MATVDELLIALKDVKKLVATLEKMVEKAHDIPGRLEEKALKWLYGPLPPK